MSTNSPADYPPPGSHQQPQPEAPAQAKTEMAPEPAATQMPTQAQPPPPGYFPQPHPVAPPKRGNFGRGFGLGAGVGLGLGAAMVALSVVAGIFSLMSLGVLLAGGSSGTSALTEPVWGDPAASETVWAVPVTGAILTDGSSGGLFAVGTYGYEIAEQIDDIDGDAASALVLLVDTPGGTITGSKAISDAVERYQERTGNQVFVHVTGMSASGGVYATAMADEIIADHGTLVGSIGVIMGPIPYYDGVVAEGDILEGWVETTGGIEYEYLTAGENKDFGNPYRPMTDREREVMTDMLETEYQNFIDHVVEGRGISEATIRDELGAHVFEPSAAQEFGLVDGMMGREEFFRHVATQAGLDPDDTVVEQLAPPTGFASLLGVERTLGMAPAVDGPAGELVSQGFCGAGNPLVFAGDIKAVCGR